MKKAIFKGFAVAALALAVIFTGCSNDSNIESFRADSVKVTAKAFPGFNYVSWTLPESDTGAKITLQRDDKVIGDTTSTGTGLTTIANGYYIDEAVSDGISYTYTVYITPSSTYKPVALNTGAQNDYSTGYIMKGNSASDSCKAINPICIKDGKLMTALDLCEYEVGGDSDFVINEENIIFQQIITKIFQKK